MDITTHVAEYIERNSLLSPGEKVVLGVSGGADSCCLLYCLHSLGYEMVIGHLNHQIRPESAEEAQYVGDLGYALGVETILGSEDVRKLAEGGLSLEEAARIARYRFLTEVAQKVGTTKIATGHTANDQVETVLMHLLQGAGSSGLRGMLPLTRLDSWSMLDKAEELTLIRPLLDVRRAQTETYCADLGIQISDDASNQDLTFLRNRIRIELIPYLCKLNPEIETVLLRMASVMEGEANFLEAALDEKWGVLVTDERIGNIRFSRDRFEELAHPIKRIFLRRIIQNLAQDLRKFGFVHIEDVINFLGSERTFARWQLPSGLELVLLNDEVTLHEAGENIKFDQFPQLKRSEGQVLEPPANFPLAEGWKLICKTTRMDEFSQEEEISSLDSKIAAIDIRNLCGLLTLRTPIPGDRFQPFGMQGSMKLSDFFINSKIPQPARDFWPLVCDDDGIVWVVGLRISSRVKISTDTSDMIVLQVDPPKEESK